jgi:methylenetetrahydrofolate--tRNA-(uracil-5-)-methyltransferase
MNPEALTYEQASELLAARKDAAPSRAAWWFKAARAAKSTGAKRPGPAKPPAHSSWVRLRRMQNRMIHIIGGGLAGSEAAWQAASRGVRVVLHEMRPVRPTAVHKTDRLAELVCSNSFRGDKLDNAVGLLKEEMRRLGSLVMRAADAHRVPAGAALAVDRERFSEAITRAHRGAAADHRRPRGDHAIPDDPAMFPLVIATGPLTSESLSADIASLVGGDHLYFYDAISPIVLSETIDRSKSFARRAGAQPAWHRRGRFRSEGSPSGCCNRRRLRRGRWRGRLSELPDDEAEYTRSTTPSGRESATVHDFRQGEVLRGLLPIEVMAHRGRDTLRFGPMKPVGLVDPRTGRTPYAVVQLRQDNLAGDHFSLVGFQTQLKWGEQARVLRDDSRARARRVRAFGMVHRNTYINGPTCCARRGRRARAAICSSPADFRGRGLRRVRGVWAHCRPQRRRAGAR